MASKDVEILILSLKLLLRFWIFANPQNTTIFGVAHDDVAHQFPYFFQVHIPLFFSIVPLLKCPRGKISSFLKTKKTRL
jgi:hypothetical protein